MTDNIDDDEALFDDIYEDDSKSEVKDGEKKNENENEEKKPDEKPGSGNSGINSNNNEDDLGTGKPSEMPAARTVPSAGEPTNNGKGGMEQSYAQPQTAQPQVPSQASQMPSEVSQMPSQVSQMPPMQPQYTSQHQSELPAQRVPDGYNSKGEPVFHDKVKAELDGKEEGKMFIGGLTWETDEESLGKYFGQFGEVTELHIMRDTATGRSRGFAFLTFKDSKSVDEVLKQKHVLDGKLIDPKRAIPREEQDKTGKIFVGGIAPDVTHQEFTDYFKQFGDIIDSQLMLDKDTGKSRGYGFVTYDSADAVARVTRNKYVMFHGRQMEIKKAEPRNQQRKPHGGFGSYGGAAPGYTPVAAGQQMVNPYMQMAGGYYGQGNMAQYWQQMQQMQQYWMRMQQMQQAGGGTGAGAGQMAQPAGLPEAPAAEGAGRDPSPVGEAGSAGAARADDEDDEVPNPQERPQPRLPSGPRNFRGASRRRAGRGSSHHHSGGGRGRNAGGYHPYRR